MAAPTATSKITLTDGNGTISELTHTSNATFELNPAGTTLTITVTGAPVITVAGAVPGLQLPSAVTNRVAITDLAGNGWNLAGSADTTI
jgi:hypothetical protein